MSPQSPIWFDGRTSSHPSRRGPIVVILVLLLTAGALLEAQIPDTAASRRHIYNRHLDTTFAVGAYKGSEVEGGTLSDVWTFADALGLTLLRVNFGTNGATAAAMASSTLRGTKRLVASTDLATLAGFGVEAQFYPFDSAQSPYSVHRFLDTAGGERRLNAVEVDEFLHRPVTERVYTDTNTSAGQMIAGDIVFSWNSAQTYRFPGPVDSTQNASAILDQYYNPYAGRTGNAHAGKTFYITATGHLFYPTSSLHNDSTVLMIEVLYEVPKGKGYVSELLPIIKYLINPYDTSITGPIERAYAPTPVIFREAFVTEEEMRTSADSLAALEGFIVRDTTQDLTFVYDTLYVTKAQLLRENHSIPEGRYYSASIPINLERCDTCRPGPLFPGQESRRINLKVYWMGGENVALRSISIRDSLGELVLGNDPAFRDAVMDEFEAALPRDGNGAPVQGIVSMVVGNEPSDYEYGGYNRVSRMLKEGFHVGEEEGDSLQAWAEGVRYGWRNVFDNRHHLVDAGIVSVEIGFNASIRDTVLRDENSNPIQPEPSFMAGTASSTLPFGPAAPHRSK